MIQPATLTAPCKINLYLEITGRRPDGYHELRTVFYPLAAPADTLAVTSGPPGSGLVLTCNRDDLSGADNILHKAWRKYGQATGFAPDLNVRLDKNIPTGAGLGGGSSDAAALLVFLERAAVAAGPAGFRPGLGPEGLNGLAAGLGADVPFFLSGEPAYAEGIGERLRPVRADLDGFAILLACPAGGVNTAWAYKALDEAAGRRAGGPEWGFPKESLTISGGMGIGPVSFEPPLLRNMFEPVVFAARPDIRELKFAMLAGGAAAAMMSGSGAAVFGLFRDTGAAKAVMRGLPSGTGGWLRVPSGRIG